jgi:diacylglycerol kinase family enzyme
MKVIVLRNAAAGTTPAEDAEAEERQLRAAFEPTGAQVEVHRVEGRHLTQTARRLAEQNGDGAVIVAAGGDGTQRAVAAALAGTGATMGVLPMGTLNHFAKDLGIPLDLAGAARVITSGRPRPIDVAAVNGRVFVNNSSIGLYPHVVRHRDQMRERLGHGKWLAMFLAIIAVFRRFPLVRVRLLVHGESWTRTTPFVFVGNNQYEIERFNLGGRSSLERGDLCVYFANRTGRLGMVRLALRALLGRLRQDRDFNALCATEVTIDTSRRHLPVAFDGEVEQMPPPLTYRIRPRALNVMLPVATETSSAASTATAADAELAAMGAAG